MNEHVVLLSCIGVLEELNVYVCAWLRQLNDHSCANGLLIAFLDSVKNRRCWNSLLPSSEGVVTYGPVWYCFVCLACIK